jgi:hypothetical protein
MQDLPAYLGAAVIILAIPALGPLVLFRLFARAVTRT